MLYSLKLDFLSLLFCMHKRNVIFSCMHDFFRALVVLLCLEKAFEFFVAML